jgi:hypothetical protein
MTNDTLGADGFPEANQAIARIRSKADSITNRGRRKTTKKSEHNPIPTAGEKKMARSGETSEGQISAQTKYPMATETAMPSSPKIMAFAVS